MLVRVRTVKGYGVKATEENASGGHGFPLKGGEKIVEFVSEICGGEVPEALMKWAQELRSQWEAQEAAKAAAKGTSPSVKKDKIQSGLAQAAIQAAQEGYPVFSVSSDVQGSTGIASFRKAFDRFVEVGIAESNMVSVGAGYAKIGFIPIVDTFGQFGVTKETSLSPWQSFASSCDCHLFPCWISGCRGWCEPSGNHLFCGHQLHPSHGGHCAFLLR